MKVATLGGLIAISALFSSNANSCELKTNNPDSPLLKLETPEQKSEAFGMAQAQCGYSVIKFGELGVTGRVVQYFVETGRRRYGGKDPSYRISYSYVTCSSLQTESWRATNQESIHCIKTDGVMKESDD